VIHQNTLLHLWSCDEDDVGYDAVLEHIQLHRDDLVLLGHVSGSGRGISGLMHNQEVHSFLSYSDELITPRIFDFIVRASRMLEASISHTVDVVQTRHSFVVHLGRRNAPVLFLLRMSVFHDWLMRQMWSFGCVVVGDTRLYTRAYLKVLFSKARQPSTENEEDDRYENEEDDSQSSLLSR
jgi:hypothetical protein